MNDKDDDGKDRNFNTGADGQAQDAAAAIGFVSHDDVMAGASAPGDVVMAEEESKSVQAVNEIGRRIEGLCDAADGLWRGRAQDLIKSARNTVRDLCGRTTEESTYAKPEGELREAGLSLLTA